MPSLLSETTEVVANPDGTYTAEVHAGPTRYQDENGEWRPVDLTLTKRSDGTVAPKGHPRGLVISGAAEAGDHDLAKLASGGSKLTLGWTGKLPEPDLLGTTATYREVRPGVDLVVDATRTGFEQLLVIKTRAAASEIKSVAMPWRTAGVVPSSDANGGLTLRGKDGKYVGHVPPAVMWDASVGAESGDHLRRVPVPMTVKAGAKSGSKALALTPEQDFFSDPATTYPVTIDPNPTLKPGFDTLVQDNIGSDLSTSKELKLGSVTDHGTYRARSFIRWPTKVLADKRITAATLYLWNTHSWNCDDHEWQVWITEAVGTSTRWSKQPRWRSDYPVAKSSVTKGYSGCTAGYITANVQPLFATAADHGWQTLTTGLRAKSSDEADPGTHSWKKFQSSEDSKDPYVSLTYNTQPSAPKSLTIGAKKCGSSDPAAFVSKANGYPSAQAKASDPDGTERSLTVKFFVAKKGAALPDKPTMTKAATSGASATVAIPKSFGLVENQAYTMYARTYDGLDDSPLSVACTFTIDSTGPQSPPTVTSADYPECTATACESAGGVGKSGLFTLGAHGVADIMQYRYWFDGGPKVTTAAVTKGGGATVRIDPPPLEETLHLEDLTRGGPRTLHVVSVDQAGRESGEYTSGTGDDSVGGYKILAGSAPTAEAWWKLDEPTGSAGVADSTSHAHDLTTAGTVSSTEGGGDGGSAYAFGLSGTAQGPLAVDLRGSRTTAATVRLSTAAGESTIVRHTKNGDPFLQDELYFDGATKKVCYRVQAGAATTANPPPRGEWKACAAAPSTLGVWLRVAGGFDAMRREAFVSVDGVRTASSAVAAYTAPATGTGGLTAIGDKELVGAVDDVRVWNRLLGQDEIGALAVADAGRWDLDSSVEDATENRVKHPLGESELSDDQWNDFGHVEGDLGSAYFAGTSSLSTSGKVLRTDQSFSVSAWVSLNKVPATNMTVLAQDGSLQSVFYLGVRQWGSTPRWAFSMQNADSASTVAFTHAISSTDAVTDDDVGGWVHLVGVYDASSQTQTLYVNGVPTQPTARTARWQANGPLAIGRALYTPANGTTAQVDKIEGSVDAVRAYAGVLTPDMVERLYETKDGQL
ncbi:LamG-like jellyroll fold domain-containing protein [Actinoplanes sp. NPDC049548]|uniref:LamG-like jellyroll fold domain-containing protein n=1 Tax=Actinoplanes sp. NPDC049548 TaxID=3155152 RepID=UPI00341F7223